MQEAATNLPEHDLTFVLFHRSLNNLQLPSMLAQALKLTYRASRIVFLTDKDTSCDLPADEVIRYHFSSSSIMLSRIEAYAYYHTVGGCIYLDTDMLPSLPMTNTFLGSLRVC